MDSGKIYIYGRHAVEEAERHAPHALKRVFMGKKSAGQDGYVAIVDVKKLLIPYADFFAKLKPNVKTALVLLGGLSDPHNVGAIIRSAVAFGFSGVLIPARGQAPVTSTVAKTSAGMIFSIPLITISSIEETLRDLKQKGFEVFGLAGKGAASLPQEKFEKPAVFVVGSEGAGMNVEVEKECSKLLSIPISAKAESLNAAAAAAVVMYEWSKTHG